MILNSAAALPEPSAPDSKDVEDSLPERSALTRSPHYETTVAPSGTTDHPSPTNESSPDTVRDSASSTQSTTQSELADQDFVCPMQALPRVV